MSSSIRNGVLVVAGLFGAWMLYQTFGSSKLTGGTVLLYFLIGFAASFVAAAWQYRSYTAGEDTLSPDEVPAHEPTWARFMSRSVLASPLWLGIRLFLSYDWLLAGYHKLIDPKWFVTG